MKLEMSPTKRVLCLIAIMFTSVAVMVDLAIIPIISDLYKNFGDQMSLVNFIVSGPQIIIVLASLLTTLLMRKVNKKTLLIVSGVIFTVGAVAGIAIVDPTYIAIMRALVGLGAGILNVVAVSMIADLYEDGKTRAKITGYYNAALSLVGMVFSYAGGWLAVAFGWTSVWNIYWLAIPMLVFIILFVPSIRPADSSELADNASSSDADADAAGADKPAKESLGWRYWVMEICWFALNVVFGATVLYFLSSYITENSLGDAAFSGTAAAVKSIVGFLICFAYGWISSKLGRQTNTVSCLIAAACMVVLIIWPSQFNVIVLMTLAGCCYKISFSYAYSHGFEIVPTSRTDDATAITTAVYGLGSFASTYYATWIMGVMGTELVTPTWIVAAVVMVAISVVEFVTSRIEKGQE